MSFEGAGFESFRIPFLSKKDKPQEESVGEPVARRTWAGDAEEDATPGLLQRWLLDRSDDTNVPESVRNALARDRQAEDLRNTEKQRLADERAAEEALLIAAQLDEAQNAYKAKDFDEAKGRFKKIAHKAKGTPSGELAQFMVGECQFHEQRYAWSQDAYARLMKDYPSTGYADRASARLFEIARIWLNAPEMATSSEIEQVSFNKSTGAIESNVVKKSSGRSWGLIPNFIDRTRPVFDTEGRAIQALRSIWLNNPGGPHADDALMLTASHFLRKGDDRAADRYFDMLRESYPKSDYLEQAFVLGSHVKLMSYQGTGYDAQKLEDAKSLKESTIRLFPNSADRERITRELAYIEEKEAQRDWERVEFWLKKKHDKRAAAVYCREVIRNHPNSKYADMATKTLAEIGHEVSPTARRPAPVASTPKDSREAKSRFSMPKLLPSFDPSVLKPKMPRLLPFLNSNDDEQSSDKKPKPISITPAETDDNRIGRVRL